MSFSSYAHEYEDVLLWRALKDTPDGFYVNLGVGDLADLLLTRGFYESGWRGVNMTPIIFVYELLRSMRAEDVNVNLDPSLRSWHGTLSETSSGKSIHLMNISPYGVGLDDLFAFDLNQWRPWLLAVDRAVFASDPLGQARWDAFLLAHGYDLVYSGSRRYFYAAGERTTTKEYFHLSPGLLVDMARVYQAGVAQQVEEARAQAMQALAQEIASLKRELQDKDQELALKDRELLEKETVIQNFRRSLSYTFLHGPFRVIPVFDGMKATRLAGRFVKRIVKNFVPRVGKFFQYPPEPCPLPDRYFSVEKLPSLAPSISIVARRGLEAPFLERALKSVVCQGYPRLEYILVGPGNETGSLANRFERHVKQLLAQPGSSQVQALNQGLQQSTGEIMACLSTHDVLLPGALEIIAHYFLTHPGVDVVYGYRLLVNESDLAVGDWVLPAHDDQALRRANYIPPEALFWRRRIWEKVGGLLDDAYPTAHFWDLLLRFQEAGAVFACLPRFLSAFRVYPGRQLPPPLEDASHPEFAKLRRRALGRDLTRQQVEAELRAFYGACLAQWWKHQLEIRRLRHLARQKHETPAAPWYERESVFFYSVHKAGTSLFTHILRQADELTHVDYETAVYDNTLPDQLTYEKYGHLYGVFRLRYGQDNVKALEHIAEREFVKDKTIVFLVRDPRDILVSWYYSMGVSHTSNANPELQSSFLEERGRIRASSLDQLVLSNAPRIGHRLEILYELSQACRRKVVLRYEELVAHFDDFFRDFSLYISIPEERKRELFLASRPKDNEDVAQHKRSGKAGQYKEKLRPETIRELNQMLWPVLEKFGYEIEDE